MNWIIYTMLALAILILAVSTMLYRRRRWVDAEKSLDNTLAACRSLLALVGHFQQHRGMSSALLSGDQGFRARLDGKGREIEGLIPSLREVARAESARAHPCLTLNDLSLFQYNWGQLREKLAGLSVEQSIAQHSFLIDQLLQWLAALGESRVELLLGDRSARGLVRNYASRLPALTECLGQARALGMSVAARRGCSAVARVRLMFLVARAETLLNQANEVGGRGPKAEKAAIAVQQMARVIRTQMLLSSGISVAAEEYFAIATAAVDSVFAWIGECGGELMQAGTGKADVRASTRLQRV
ncbi:MAG: nitrate- and nitrite sensing domain-containing protein [Dechloromonas sp.]|uniref:nitrate- and nitrite sensing domain-containing protein n=1 Tax=Ferribacterium limneticum TaxID=76259 RepID=UPI001CF8827C|nr:nitrate- and nitrite sensing domain-containing protein [Ferribacterium limneticum]MBT9520773.1 nitrate- and nitrite sensing domain-containing protein [Dechloromonas sp.]UCV21518.1 nitrate- and nitrite sensing domain-containing protein [Ferribacterium limneticum]